MNRRELLKAIGLAPLLGALGVKVSAAPKKSLPPLPEQRLGYLGLLRDDGTEVSGNGYARVPIQSLSGAVEFPEATGDWGTMALWCRCETADSRPTILGRLDGGRPIEPGDTVRVWLG